MGEKEPRSFRQWVLAGAGVVIFGVITNLITSSLQGGSLAFWPFLRASATVSPTASPSPTLTASPTPSSKPPGAIAMLTVQDPVNEFTISRPVDWVARSLASPDPNIAMI